MMGAELMKNKPKGMGLGIALGAALGAALGVAAGHLAIWLAVGVAIGVAIGGSLRSKGVACSECAAVHQQHENKNPRATKLGN
jgi:RsiW-degrading membrane proteinase PrsW (M82 family)